MPSRSCETARRSAFTLLELLVVVGLLAMAAALVAAGVGGSSASARQRGALEGLATELLLARIDAMRSGSDRRLDARLEADELRVSRPGRERTWKAGGLLGLAPREEFSARFDPSGRTSERLWRFSRDAEAANTLFVIEFDPVSGAPDLRRASERSPFTEDRP